MRFSLLCIAFIMTLTGMAFAENEVRLYAGYQSATESRLQGDNDGDDFDLDVDWEGRPLDPPIYYGVRYTRWQNDNWGWGVELNHSKAYADDDSRDEGGFETFELTHGLNIVTVNGFYRWKDDTNPWTPYVGVGAGLSIPHVDVEIGDNRTYGYQITGPAAVVMAGVTYDINATWAVFGEYRGSYSSNTAELDGGGDFETNITTNAVNLGVVYKW